MKSALRFADFFGAIDFDDDAFAPGANITCDDPDAGPFDIVAERRRAHDYRREIDKAAKYLAIVGKERIIATHNANAERMAREIAQAWAMQRCAKCGRYEFENDGKCLHCVAEIGEAKP